MKYLLKFKSINFLEKRHLKLVKDKAHIYISDKKKQNIFFSFMTNIYQIKSPLNILDPNNSFLILWEIFIFAILSMLIFYVPYHVSFSFLPNFTQQYSVSLIMKYVPFILIIDSFININTGYYDKGTTVKNRKLIILNYLKIQFSLDFITISSILYLSNYSIVFLLRIYQFNQLINKIDENFQLQYKIPTFFNLFKLLLTIIIVAHFCGCGFHFITNYN